MGMGVAVGLIGRGVLGGAVGGAGTSTQAAKSSTTSTASSAISTPQRLIPLPGHAPHPIRAPRLTADLTRHQTQPQPQHVERLERDQVA
ncbi:MAG: hypothetical protein JW910_23575, partial [Anaerolineae bacterium]|nr:hypothetical protein [Anaerolineae bacterium]